jgi:hypothetical protein
MLSKQVVPHDGSRVSPGTAVTTGVGSMTGQVVKQPMS